MNEYTTGDPVIIIIGSKADIYSGHCVNRQEIEVQFLLKKLTQMQKKEFANDKGFPYYLVSAKTNENIMESFVHVVTELIDKRYSENSNYLS